MLLYASPMSDRRQRELLAELNVVSDTAEPWGINIRRHVTGSLRHVGSAWDRCLETWRRLSVSPAELDGRRYVGVRGLQVDHDHYGFLSWINVERPTVRLLLVERFRGSVEEYYDLLRERNARVQRCLDRWDHRKLTPNDLREMSGYGRTDRPGFDDPLPPAVVEKARTMHSKEHLARKSCNNIL